MRVEALEAGFPSDQEDDRADSLEAPIATGFAFGALKQAIDRFKKAIAQPTLCPRDNTVDMVPDYRPYDIHLLHVRAHDVGAPLMQYGANDVDLHVLEKHTQVLSILRSTRVTLGSQMSEQCVETGAPRATQADLATEQRPAQALDIEIELLLGSTGQVEHVRRMRDHMKLVEDDLLVRHALSDAFDKNRRTIDTDRIDGHEITDIGAQIVGRTGDRIDVTGFGDEERSAAFGIGSQRDVVVPTGARRYVDLEFSNLEAVGLLEREVDIALCDRNDAAPTLAAQSRNGGERYLAAQTQNQGLEEQGEAAQRTSPCWFNQAHRPGRQFDPRHSDFEEALVLEEV